MLPVNDEVSCMRLAIDKHPTVDDYKGALASTGGDVSEDEAVLQRIATVNLYDVAALVHLVRHSLLLPNANCERNGLHVNPLYAFRLLKRVTIELSLALNLALDKYRQVLETVNLEFYHSLNIDMTYTSTYIILLWLTL